MTAALNPIDYDQTREAIARRLKIRVSTLDTEVEKRRTKADSPVIKSEGRVMLLSDPEPWGESVDGASLLDALLTLFERYVILPAGAAVAIVLWVLHTYLMDAAEASPILAITSPEKRC